MRRHVARWAPGLVLPALVLGQAPARVAAQTVAGQVVQADGGAPVASAIVVLLDTLGRAQGGALSDADGRFVLRAPAPGRFTVRAERVGSQSTSSAPLQLGAGDSLTVRLGLRPAVRLQAMRVTAQERCRVRPAEGELAARLWDEARKALAGTTMGPTAGGAPRRIGRFVRRRDAHTLHLQQETWRLQPAAFELFRSLPVDALGARGFVEPGATPTDSITFYAPDAEVLLSDAFLQTHCLRAVAPPPGRRGQIGVSVEPVRRRTPRLPDIRGTLWIDTTSMELRTFEFSYVDPPENMPPGPAGGHVGFARDPAGRWFVEDWAITMPLREAVLVPRAASPSMLAPAFSYDTASRAVVVEEGGRALTEEIVRAPDALRTVVTGVLVDSSAGGQPVANATIGFVDTPYAGITNEFGEFYFEAGLVGAQTLRVAHPRARSLGLSWNVALPVRLGGGLHVSALFPSRATLRRAYCGRAAADTAGTLVAGLVERTRAARRPTERPTPQPVSGADVEVRWRLQDWPAHWWEQRRARSDARGHYWLCDVPAGATLEVRARAGKQWSTTARLDSVAPSAVLTQDLLLVPGYAPTERWH